MGRRDTRGKRPRLLKGRPCCRGLQRSLERLTITQRAWAANLAGRIRAAVGVGEGRAIVSSVTPHLNRRSDRETRQSGLKGIIHEAQEHLQDRNSWGSPRGSRRHSLRAGKVLSEVAERDRVLRLQGL